MNHKVWFLIGGLLGLGILLVISGAPAPGIFLIFLGFNSFVAMLVGGLVFILRNPDLATAKSHSFSAAPPPVTAPPPKVDAATPSREKRDEQRQVPPPPKPPPRKSAPPKRVPIRSDHAGVLGLTGKFTFEDVKRHYHERMKEYHPDRVAHLGVNIRELAEAETKKLNEAYEFFQCYRRPPRRVSQEGSKDNRD